MKVTLYPSRIEAKNLGDILINALLIRELIKHSKVYFKGQPPAELLQLISSDNLFNSRVSILNIPNKTYIKYKFGVLKFLLYNKADYTFEAPGHLSSRDNKYKSIIKNLLDFKKVLIYKLFGVKYIRLGITLGPYSIYEWKIVRLINKISFKHIVRDTSNYQELLNKNFNVDYLPDLAFLLFNNPILKNNINYNERIRTKFDILISLRGNIKGKTIDIEFVNKQIKKIEHLITHNEKIKNVVVTHQVDADNKVSEIIFNELSFKFPNITFELIREKLTFEEAIKYYSNSNLVLTNRLHVFLFTMSLEVKTLVITDNLNHTKLISIIKDLNLQILLSSKHKEIDFESINEKYKSAATINKLKIEEHISALFI